MKKHLLLLALISVFTACFAALGVTFVNLIKAETSKENLSLNLKLESENIVKSPIDQYYVSDIPGKTSVLAAVGKGDARPIIIDNFLAMHRSPMAGLGQVFVSAADDYGIDYRLLPAIAFQESTLGKYTPKNSHNAFGWAIYTGQNSGASFKNWSQAIVTVAKGLKVNYIDQGLVTPEEIMNKYSDSDGEWAFGVNFAINQMTPR